VLQQSPALATALEAADLVVVAQHSVIFIEHILGTAVSTAVTANVVEVLQLASGECELTRIVSAAHDDPGAVGLVDEPLVRLIAEFNHQLLDLEKGEADGANSVPSAAAVQGSTISGGIAVAVSSGT
jgi:hypothetical protein